MTNIKEQARKLTTEELARFLEQMAEERFHLAADKLRELEAENVELREIQASQAQKIGFLVSVVRSGEQLTGTEEEMLVTPRARLLK